MNNLTLGNDDFTYYETLGGGQGACPDADGPSASTWRCRTRSTRPVEALELEFPLRVVEYAVRRGSGGAGAHRGGDGIVRELEALEPMELSLITERRRHAPARRGRRRATARAGATCSTARSSAPKVRASAAARRPPADRDARRRRARPRAA